MKEVRFKKQVQETFYYEAEYNDVVILIRSEPIYEAFGVYLIFGRFEIEMGSFESLAESKRYVKNGMHQINNIIEHLKGINKEVLDFKLEPN